MKYWRGYLVAAILAACAWGLQEFAASHWVLVDMIYPYVTRMVQTFLAQWSAELAFCLWQVLLLALGVGVVASIVLMIVLRWNVIQWFGWVLTAASVVFLLHTGIYGLNKYAAPLAEDIRLHMTDYTITELEDAAEYYRDEANKLANTVDRDASGHLQYPSFDELAQQAGEGFQTLTHRDFYSAFAGTVVPVKELGWSSFFSARGIAGIHVPLTGEAAVNPETPVVGLPFVICRQMAKRMCIANEQDAALAAFLTCRANEQVPFRYAAYFMAYRYCVNALTSSTDASVQKVLAEIRQGENANLRQDVQEYDDSFAAASDAGNATALEGEDVPKRYHVTDLLTSLYIQEVVLPLQMEEEVQFDPMDETQVDLSGIANAMVPESSEANE